MPANGDEVARGDSVAKESLAQRLRRQSGGLDSVVVQMLSFSDDKELLRGTSLAVVLHGFARIFAHSKGSGKEYGLSRKVSELDAFISHNWDVARHKKFLTLAVHFNFHLAALALGIAMVVLVALSAAGVLPTITIGGVTNQGVVQEGICLRLLCSPICLTLLLGGEMRSCLGSQKPMLFLDKTCIDQEDKGRGIQKLGAFVASSSSMVIVYTDLYLQKLWTVFEVATFVSVHGTAGMHLVPLMVPVCLIVTLSFSFGTHALNVVLIRYASVNATSAMLLLSSIMNYFFVLALRWWARDRASAMARSRAFSLVGCKCADERDRPVVCANIARLMRAGNVVSTEASEAEALGAFENIVQSELPHAMATSVSRLGVPLTNVCMMTFAIWGAPSLDRLAGLSSGVPFRRILVLMMRDFNMAMFAKVFFMVGARLCSYRLELRSCRELCYVGAVSALTFGMVLAHWIFLVLTLDPWSRTSDMGLGVYFAYSLAMIVCVCATFSKRGCSGDAGERGQASNRLSNQFHAMQQQQQQQLQQSDVQVQGTEAQVGSAPRDEEEDENYVGQVHWVQV